MTTKEVLLRAADLIEQNDLCKGVMAQMPDGQTSGYLSARATCFCVVGALSRTCYALEYTWLDVGRFAVSAIKGYLGLPDDYLLSQWNDEPERTKEDVVAALRGAAGTLPF